MSSIDEVWLRLSEIQSLRFASESHSATNWGGAGRGIVLVSERDSNVLVFHEAGRWQQTGGREMRFSNVFRWTRLENRLQLEHLRFGTQQPVFLFEMVCDPQGLWRESVPHPCRDDCYCATLHLEQCHVALDWSVTGPRRDERISYVYR